MSKSNDREPAEEVHGIELREQARQSLASDIEAFLKEGGKVQSVEPNLRADPPKRPENNYGRGSI